jgi:hypothetical protein
MSHSSMRLSARSDGFVILLSLLVSRWKASVYSYAHRGSAEVPRLKCWLDRGLLEGEPWS